MDTKERNNLIDQLDRSFSAMPHWVKCATKHGMAAPTMNPETGEPFKSFRDCLEAASDWTLETLRDDFDDNGDLLPQELM
jgi:hypothetical protein